MKYKIGDIVRRSKPVKLDLGANLLPYVLTGTFPEDFFAYDNVLISTQEQLDYYNSTDV